MTPKEFCEYVVECKVFAEISSADTDHAEQGRYIWPDRYRRLIDLAKAALQQGANLQCPSCYSTMDEIRECKKCGHTERR